MLEMVKLPASQLDPFLQLEPEEALEWRAQLDERPTGWHDVESSDELVAVAQSIGGEGDWFTVQTKDFDVMQSGRYAQAMNIGNGYQVEVAQQYGQTIYNWRIGLGAEADHAGNGPDCDATGIQRLSLAAVIGVLLSWSHGHGLPLGYGAALHVYAP